MSKKKLFIKTYGCQMNVYDSGRMADMLGPLGYQAVDGPGDADLVIMNTCHIREKASEKVYSELGRLRMVQQEKQARGSDMILAVAGCVAQAEGAAIMERAPYVDMVFGPQTYHRLPEMVANATRSVAKRQGKSGKGVGILDTDFPVEPKFDHMPKLNKAPGVSAFLSVQEGCDKFCTFCVVPYTRGAEFSRPVVKIEEEARHLVALGVREITLLGQNVNAYHGTAPDGEKEWGLGPLVRRLARIDGLERIRYTTSHPRDMDDDLIAAHGDVPQLMPFLHLPVQSGSDRILEAMNRKHTADDYRRIIDRLREARPDIALSSDFIVGFPGETDKDFEDTMALIEEITFAQAYSFKYSPRPGTPASAMDLQIDSAVQSERLERLQALIRDQQVAFNRATIGKVLPVLFERKGRHEGQIIGRSPYLQSVHVEASPRLIGHTLDVRIEADKSNSLAGSVIIMDDETTTTTHCIEGEGFGHEHHGKA